MQNIGPQPRIHDRELLVLAQSPDEKIARTAFTSIWQQYDAPLRECISWLLGKRRAETPDVLGDLACGFWKRLRTSPPLEISAKDLWPYLKRSAHNQVASHLKGSASPLANKSVDAQLDCNPALPLVQATGTHNDEEWLCAYSLVLISQQAQSSDLLLEKIGMSPEQMDDEQARAAEWLKDYGTTCFIEALRQLPPSSRDVLILRCVFKLSSREVAQILDISTTAVDNRLLRAKRQLRDIYASLLLDKGIALAQIGQNLAAFESPKLISDESADERRVLEFVDNGYRLRRKAKE
jgi:RNA polymerase sigma factor (sigma-70 family)